MQKPALHPDIPFLGKFHSLALEVERTYGVPALATLAQHVLEAGRDNKNRFFNYFGVKADKRWTGATQDQLTWEWHKDNKQAGRYGADFIRLEPYQGGFKYHVRQRFRAYESPRAAYLDRGKFLRDNPRYRAAFQTKDPAEFCRRIAAAGYATDNQYANKLVTMVAQLGKKLPLVPSTKPDAPALRPSEGHQQEPV
ncbi:hypothetical protein GCM10023185_38310 [Hymenobacter saemangeumensis]|uniref:Mannosyl-glycoprotein endo-beta-N-acetylglucosamidase-like domain-containing protein n=1 Tax=Hymenobacter saemangeumensis TaxID=1084522 RepID=A0ABP8IRD6_9BACT